MSDEQEALDAIWALNGTKLNGKAINVEVSVYICVTAINEMYSI